MEDCNCADVYELNDDSIMVIRRDVERVWPITKRPFHEPMRNMSCGHEF